MMARRLWIKPSLGLQHLVTEDLAASIIGLNVWTTCYLPDQSPEVNSRCSQQVSNDTEDRSAAGVGEVHAPRHAPPTSAPDIKIGCLDKLDDIHQPDGSIHDKSTHQCAKLELDVGMALAQPRWVCHH
jgi:hypothetical protein